MIYTRLPVLGAIALMIFNCAVAVAGPNQTSADYVMSGCRDAASLITFSNVRESEEEAYRKGLCAGIIVGLSFMGQPQGICVPAGTTTEQAFVARRIAAGVSGDAGERHQALRGSFRWSVPSRRRTPSSRCQSRSPVRPSGNISAGLTVGCIR